MTTAAHPPKKSTSSRKDSAPVPKAITAERKPRSTGKGAPSADFEAMLREREAELAIVNEVGQALAQQLDLNAIGELVGERLSETFPGKGLFVAFYDATSNVISFPYEVQIGNGKRYHTDPMPVETGLTGKVIRTRKTLLVRSHEQALSEGAVVIGKTTTESWLGVPMVAADDLIGVIALESGQPNEFDDGDVQLVSTLAASAAVALHNAKLLAETTQRNAELAVINDIGEALAKQLDFDSITEVVGERIRSIFHVSTVLILLYDAAGERLTFPVHGRPGPASLPRTIARAGPERDSRTRTAVPAPQHPGGSGGAWGSAQRQARRAVMARRAGSGG